MTISLLIDGEERPAKSGRTFDRLDPFTGALPRERRSRRHAHIHRRTWRPRLGQDFQTCRYRIQRPRSLRAVELLVAAAVDHLKSAVEVRVGEGSLDRLRKALSRGYLEEGFDPDAEIFHTFEEERWAQRYKVRNLDADATTRGGWVRKIR